MTINRCRAIHVFFSFRNNSLSYIRQLNSIAMELLLRKSILLEFQRLVLIIEFNRIEMQHPTIIRFDFKIGIKVLLLLYIWSYWSSSDFTQLPSLQTYYWAPIQILEVLFAIDDVFFYHAIIIKVNKRIHVWTLAGHAMDALIHLFLLIFSILIVNLVIQFN